MKLVYTALNLRFLKPPYHFLYNPKIRVLGRQVRPGQPCQWGLQCGGQPLPVEPHSPALVGPSDLKFGLQVAMNIFYDA